jgi:hypothetical protein
LTLFFVLLGSAFVKAKHEMLEKLTQAERVEDAFFSSQKVDKIQESKANEGDGR